jgi:hypothetical protein
VKPVDLYRGISDFKEAYHPKTKITKDGKDDLITDSHNILPRWRKHSLSFSIYIGLIILGRQKYIQHSHCCLSRVPWMLRWLLKS